MSFTLAQKAREVGDSCKLHERSNRPDRAAEKPEQRLDHEDHKTQRNVGKGNNQNPSFRFHVRL
jgi:hypothetical protein